MERVEKVGVTSGNTFQMSHAVFCSYQQKKKLYRIQLMHEKGNEHAFSGPILTKIECTGITL